ncbi:uncharacterized protein LACBIDRAFT_330384 [Laccaria bicolor S238N-H82]|uniref:Predicted protein n=1 Tax=Laccaria bicolor (strain S238N-H82 / ATCC MYA-4686) TaxID=486041 RepID=B0DL51_LACBS|nr:uncharacterized protein LACBIDRAFT_330384 [Laccaria bicolor S238N-H82]EDR04848.1 predicted protein [Laccaria bicolor S238N-H82]|eukprot:XP_001884672.1 predicted protein [Laccaria bicolor S238N-H82]
MPQADREWEMRVLQSERPLEAGVVYPKRLSWSDGHTGPSLGVVRAKQGSLNCEIRMDAAREFTHRPTHGLRERAPQTNVERTNDLVALDWLCRKLAANEEISRRDPRIHLKVMRPMHKSPGEPTERGKGDTLPELLGTPKGIAALAELFRKSGAFTFTGEKDTPKDAPTFEDEPEPPDIDSEDNTSDSNHFTTIIYIHGGDSTVPKGSLMLSAGLCVDSRTAPMSRNCFFSAPSSAKPRMSMLIAAGKEVRCCRTRKQAIGVPRQSRAYSRQQLSAFLFQHPTQRRLRIFAIKRNSLPERNWPETALQLASAANVLNADSFIDTFTPVLHMWNSSNTEDKLPHKKPRIGLLFIDFLADKGPPTATKQLVTTLWT